MRRPSRPAGLTPLLLALAVGVSPVVTRAALPEDVRAVGERIICYCGCTGQTVADCSCGTADEIRARIASQIDSGLSVDEVVDAWVEERGEQILAVPTREGFNLVGWIMPFAVTGLAALLVTFVIVRWSRRAPPLAAAEEPATPEDQIYRERIESDLRSWRG